MNTKKDLNYFLLGFLYGMERGNSEQKIEFNCTNMSYLCLMTEVLRKNKIEFHIERKGLRYLIVSSKMEGYDLFLKENFKINYEYPLNLKWPNIEKNENFIEFIDGLFESAGIFNASNEKSPYIVHIEDPNTAEKISQFIENLGIRNIAVKNIYINNLCTIQIFDSLKFIELFLKTNPYSKYRNSIAYFK